MRHVSREQFGTLILALLCPFITFHKLFHEQRLLPFRYFFLRICLMDFQELLFFPLFFSQLQAREFSPIDFEEIKINLKDPLGYILFQ